MIKNLGALAALTLLPVFAQASQPTGNVYSPHKGVLCDKKAGLCADEQGISMGLTKEYLGAAAEQKLLKITRNADFDGRWFVLSDGTSCKSAERVCTTSKHADTVSQKATLALYGKLPAAAKPSQAITFPAKGVICDKSAGFCVDQEGISLAFTKQYLGAAAEAKFTQFVRENPGMDLKAYVLSNGADCDSTKRTCMAERRGTEVERRYTRHLFGG